MQKIFRKYIWLLFPALLLSSCDKSESFDNTPVSNMEALWQIIDEKYCFLDYKNIDWDSVYHAFMPRVVNNISNEALLTLMDEMLDILEDGHVNVIAPFNTTRYWGWHENYAENFDTKIQKNYLGTDYYISSSMKYKVLDDNIGYVYYGSFSNGVGEGNMDHVMQKFALCKGIIIDVRDNGGGELSNMQNIVSGFIDSKLLIGYIQHKTGKGHSDFSKPYAQYIYPRSKNRYNYYKTVIVLTNRHCYSTTNEFVNAMSLIPNVKIIGDKTGGGSGLPMSAELPNGWTMRYSASPSMNIHKEYIEFGIDPDIKIDMSDEDMAKGLDSIIERARKYIHEGE